MPAVRMVDLWGKKVRRIPSFGFSSDDVTANSPSPRLSAAVRTILVVAGLAGATSFLAAPVRAIGFSGYYATGNWTINAPGDATVTVSGAAPNNTITLTSKDNRPFSQANTSFTIVADPSAPVASTVRFNWSYLTQDDDGSLWDPFGYVLNGTFFQLTANGLPTNSTQSGTATFIVQPGDVFGFNQRSVDSRFGPGITDVSGFSIIAVPVAPSLLGLLPLVLAARKRYSTTSAHRASQSIRLGVSSASSR